MGRSEGRKGGGKAAGGVPQQRGGQSPPCSPADPPVQRRVTEHGISFRWQGVGKRTRGGVSALATWFGIPGLWVSRSSRRSS